MNIIRTKFGEEVDLEELDITLSTLIPPCVSITICFASKAAYKDTLGPRIYLQDGDPDAPFNIHEVYPIFLRKKGGYTYEAPINNRPILKENLEKFLIKCYDIFLEQWEDTEYNNDSLYYEHKLNQNADKLFCLIKLPLVKRQFIPRLISRTHPMSLEDIGKRVINIYANHVRYEI